ncbi:hypothetical protein [Actinomadura sp. WAC 06369]|uniref:hypothetical protein n=1 Tax=Actinomadura sp. WAC 06369 TaxID=2203193 RepID=UPI000F7A97BF|nr:hypothetical protein [Actinomadura sp. WAC 06369]
MDMLGNLASISAPKRFKRVYATSAEESLPYLRPYDIFDYLPIAADHLSVSRNSVIDDLRLHIGTILLTCSGRNLGPAVAVDRHLSNFVLSHDAIRIDPHSTSLMPYLLTVLNSPTGQELVRRDMSGSVIDHITVADVSRLCVPLLEASAQDSIGRKMASAIDLREQARLDLVHLHDEVEKNLPDIKSNRPADGWQINAQELLGRIDSAPYLPTSRDAAKALIRAGGPKLRDVAILHKPASRYKAYHVTKEHGHPFLAGGQLRQEHVIAPKYMADRVFSEPGWYRLHADETVFAADGRAYEGLGVPVMVTPDRAGWLASEHVMRARPREGVNAGWLYLALASSFVQEQIQVLACGSVVDTLYPADVGEVVLPPPTLCGGDDAIRAWHKFADAAAMAEAAVSEFESHISEIIF